MQFQAVLGFLWHLPLISWKTETGWQSVSERGRGSHRLSLTELQQLVIVKRKSIASCFDNWLIASVIYQSDDVTHSLDPAPTNMRTWCFSAFSVGKKGALAHFRRFFLDILRDLLIHCERGLHPNTMASFDLTPKIDHYQDNSNSCLKPGAWNTNQGATVQLRAAKSANWEALMATCIKHSTCSAH